MSEKIKPRVVKVQPGSLRAAVLDWSGVISDDRKPVYEANMRVLEEHGKERIPFDEWLRRTAMTPVEFFANHGVQGDPDELYAAYKKHYDKVVQSGVTPMVYPGAKEALETIRGRGKKVAVLSSHPTENLHEEARRYSLDTLFDQVSGSCRDKVEGLRQTCSGLNESPRHTMYVGDTIYDIRSAREAECYSAGICGGYHSRERLLGENPDILFEDLSELRNWWQEE